MRIMPQTHPQWCDPAHCEGTDHRGERTSWTSRGDAVEVATSRARFDTDEGNGAEEIRLALRGTGASPDPGTTAAVCLSVDEALRLAAELITAARGLL